MRLSLFSILLFLFLQNTSEAQIVNQFNSWWTYSGNHQIAEQLSIHTLYSFRRNDFVQNWQQSLLRLGLNYHAKEKQRLTLGYDWAINFPYGEQPIAEQTTEHRLYEQYVMAHNIGKISITNGYRLEQRFLHQDVKHRFRYRLSLNHPIGKSKFMLRTFNEVFLNLGSQSNAHHFDQNWLYFGCAYRLSNQCSLKLGYMNQYLVKQDNQHIESNHTLQVGINYSADLRKSES